MTQEPTVPKSLAGIGATALGVALLRAQESSRPDRLFDDPYARHFLQAVDPAFTPWAAGPSPATARFCRSWPSRSPSALSFSIARYWMPPNEDGAGGPAGAGHGRPRIPARLAARHQGLRAGLRRRARIQGSGTRRPRRDHPGRVPPREVATDLRQDWPRGSRSPASTRGGRPPGWPKASCTRSRPKQPTCSSTGSPPSPPRASMLALDHMKDSELLRSAPRTSPPSSSTCGAAVPPRTSMPGLPAAAGSPPCDIAEAATACERPIPPAFDPARADAGRGWLATAHL